MRQVLLTKQQLEEWNTYRDPAWAGFKREWWARGFRSPPTPKQRAHLWMIADARPNDLARWTREAPGDYPNDVITHIFEQWRRLRGSVASRNRGDTEPKDRDRKAPARLGEIIRATAKDTRQR